MKKTRLAAVAASITLVAVAQLASAAKGPNYTYAEGGYVNLDSDTAEGNGFAANLSYGATDLIFIKLGFTHLFLDDPNSSAEADADRFQLGGGAHFAVTDNMDVLGALSYVDVELSNGVPSQSDDGYLLEGGVRAMLGKGLELNATVSQLHIGGDDDTGFGVGGVFDFSKDWAISGSYRQFSDDDEGELFVGLRLEL